LDDARRRLFFVGMKAITAARGAFVNKPKLAQNSANAAGSQLNIAGGSFPETKEEIKEDLGDIAGEITGGSFAGASDAIVVTTAAELQAAVAEANNGETVNVKLGENITLEDAMALTAGEMTLDLNGNNLTFPSIRVGKGVKLEINGAGNLTSLSEECFVVNGCVLTLNITGTIAVTDTEMGLFFWAAGKDESYITIQNGHFKDVGIAYGGDMTIDIAGGTFDVTRAELDKEVALSELWVKNGEYESATKFNITGGTFAEAGSEGGESDEITVTLGSDLMDIVESVNEGNTVKVKLGANITLLQTIKLSQGHLILSGEYDFATNCETFFNMAGGDLTLNVTGKVIAYRDEEGMGNDTFEMASADSDVIINSGEYQNMKVLTGKAANLTINGGSFDITRAELEAQCAIAYPEWDVEAANLTINGGTFLAE